ncbi:MAG: hypothetical protein JOZ08_26355 [Verrucomicrobia bacterium]|nr:hypothetical protein [Verrucomicrobiota bacterium]MBV8276053.1 hypothetical protein [Verrucomicrobiota bacterium]
MKITPGDRVFLMNAFRVLASFALVWCLGAIYRTTVIKPIDLPVIGKISYSGAVLVTIPVVSVLVCWLSAILVVFALSSRAAAGQTLYRVLPIFGPITQSLRRITAVLILAVVLFLNVIPLVLFVKMSRIRPIAAPREGLSWRYSGTSWSPAGCFPSISTPPGCDRQSNTFLPGIQSCAQWRKLAFNQVVEFYFGNPPNG